MKFYELEKEALSLSEVERQNLINTLMASLSVNGRRASFGCMEGTGEIIEDIVEPVLSITEWEVMAEKTVLSGEIESLLDEIRRFSEL